MGITLQIEVVLAEELRQQASDEQTSVEELAHRLMRDALQDGPRTSPAHFVSRNLNRSHSSPRSYPERKPTMRVLILRGRSDGRASRV